MTGRTWPYRLFSCPCDGEGGAQALSTEALWRLLWRRVQTALLGHGFDPGPVDGVRGPRTDAALLAFKKARGLRDRPYLGELTLEALLGALADGEPAAGADGEPRWLADASRRIGLAEIPGPRDAPGILALWRTIGAHWFADDETPWCGAFVGGVLKEAGIAILPAGEAPRARAWAGWGIPLPGPAVGAVAVLWRGAPEGRWGHVGFVAGKDDRGRLMMLGGNQSDAVTIAPFDPLRVLADGFRWPEGEPLPAEIGWSRLPLIRPRTS